MGIVRMGPPQELMVQLGASYDISTFVETGTYYGVTAFWASQIFAEVFTIEFSEDLYRQTSAKYKDVTNINFLYGDTRDRLTEIVSELETPALFWLDAHWSGGPTYGETDQSPVLEELKIITESEQDHFIFIDDARLFTSPPQPPHVVEQWPDIVTILNSLTAHKNRYIVIIEDVIIAVPEYARLVLVNYCQAVNQRLWEQFGKKNRVAKRIRWSYQGLRNRITRLR
jgi:hypothetical protein